ncbi:MAG: histone deacetylase [Myxococcota bacterium]|nr:histone deacetylase [Myxococcota bacterium]
MPRTRRFAVVEDPRYREHRGPTGHPERPERLAAVGRALDAVRDALVPIPARPADDGEILRVHHRDHLRELTRAAASAPLQLDPDTYMGPRSLEVARLAAGGTVDLARAVARGDVASGLAAVRPPGHHAEAGRAMGFCLFNNVAVAARALQAEEGVGRVLILDWDVHHGNGTQHTFAEDPSVLYLSTHQFPYYPGTGDFREVGGGRGEGATVNVPMPAGCADAEYVGVFQRVVVPVVERFKPDVLLVSAGFDAHEDDPLAAMEVSGRGFGAMARIVRALADDVCDGRLVFVLEGGYAARGLAEGVDAILAASLPEDTPALPKAVDATPGTLLAQVVERVHDVHGGRVPDLGAA